MIALDGDSLGGNSTAIAVLAVASMVVGYVLLAALWYFVFRRSPEQREADRAADAARTEALRNRRPPPEVHEDGAEAHVAASAAVPGAGPGHHNGQPLRIDRPVGPRFRRR
jgi:hypothetical protein